MKEIGEYYTASKYGFNIKGENDRRHSRTLYNFKYHCFSGSQINGNNVKIISDTFSLLSQRPTRLTTKLSMNSSNAIV